MNNDDRDFRPKYSGPQKPDPTTMLLTAPSNIHRLEEEFTMMLGQKRNRFSPQSISTLQWAGIVRDNETAEDVELTPVTTAVIRDFITRQKGFIARPSFTFPNSDFIDGK